MLSPNASFGMLSGDIIWNHSLCSTDLAVQQLIAHADNDDNQSEKGEEIR